MAALTLAEEVEIGIAAVGAGAGAYGAYSSGQSAQAAANYQAAVAKNNQTIAEANANIAQAQGNVFVENKQQQTAQMIGAERAGFSSSGLDPNVGSAVRVQSDTAKLGEQDVQTIRNSAMREAYGFRNAGLNYSAQATLDQATASNAAKAGELGAFTSLVSNASVVGDKYVNWTKNKNTDTWSGIV